jgi:hypothetical protein
MSNDPPRLLANAIRLPSGDHAGSIWKKSSPEEDGSPVLSDSRTWALPSAFIA